MELAQTTTTIAALAPGTWTELIGAVVAVLVGGLAAFFAFRSWQESKRTGEWAGIAAKAQQEANRIAQAGLRAHLRAELHPEEERIVLRAEDDSSPVWVRRVHLGHTMLQNPDGDTMVTGLAGDSVDYDPAIHLRPGNFMVLKGDWYSLFRQVPSLGPGSYMIIGVIYSWTQFGDPEPNHTVKVDLSSLGGDPESAYIPPTA
jgi:hypothetical protein